MEDALAGEKQVANLFKVFVYMISEMLAPGAGSQPDPLATAPSDAAAEDAHRLPSAGCKLLQGSDTHEHMNTGYHTTVLKRSRQLDTDNSACPARPGYPTSTLTM